MERYDYYDALYADNKDYIEENNFDINADDAAEQLNDLLFVNDSVTGNASGSYFCNAWAAEEALCHNWDLMREAMREFDMQQLGSAEGMDVTIRCYLLGQVIEEVLENLKQ